MNGVMMVRIIAVLTHRKKEILKYKEVCTWLSDGCGSKFVNAFASKGNERLKAEMVKAPATEDTVSAVNRELLNQNSVSKGEIDSSIHDRIGQDDSTAYLL